MKRVILLRGLPGSGKTTLARTLVENFITPTAQYFEADMYMINNEGEYEFNRAHLKDCHRACLDEYKSFLRREVFSKNALAVVSNTFTQHWEMVPYIDAAEKAGYQVSTLIVENRHQGESIHGVPEATMFTMMRRFEIQLNATQQFSIEGVSPLHQDMTEPEMPDFPPNDEGLCPECGAHYQDDCRCHYT